MKGYFTFSEALEFMKMGLLCARRGWNGKGMWVTTAVPDFNIRSRRKIECQRCLVMKTVDDRLTSWTPCDLDLFTNDWYIVEEDWHAMEADACP